MCYTARMKSALFLLGNRLIRDDSLVRYIHRHVRHGGYEITQVYCMETSDESFPERLDSSLQEVNFIVCAPEQSAFVGRLICSLCDDTLSLEDGELIPSRARSQTKNAYTVTWRERSIHVLVASASETLPRIPAAPPAAEKAFMLFGLDAAEAEKALGSITNGFNIALTFNRRCGGWLVCHITPLPYADVNGFLTHVSEIFEASFVRGGNIVSHLIKALENAGKTISFAEGCTGGLLGYYFIRESGASTIYEGGVVTYSNRLKSAWIAVDENTLETHGAVSEETVTEMSAGILDVSGADYAIAISGIAGPDGGTADKPVGTVYVAVRSETRFDVKRLQLKGDRNYVQEQSVFNAIAMLMMIDKDLFLKNPAIS